MNNPSRPIKTKPIQQRVMRYLSSTTSDVVVTRGDLLNWIVAVTASSTSAIPLSESVRLTRVVIVAMAESVAAPNSLCLEWDGDRSPSTCTNVMSANAIPARISQAPPKDSLARYWCLRGSDTTEALFTIKNDDTAQSLIVDLHIEYVLGDGTIAAVTLGSASSFTGIAYLVMPNDSLGLSPVALSTDILA